MSGIEKRSCLLLTIGLGLLLSDCGGGQEPINISGYWSASLTDSLGKPGSGLLQLAQHGDVLRGTFSYVASTCQHGSADVGGTISGTDVSLTKTPTDIYPIALLLTLDPAGAKLTGSYSDTSGVCGSQGSIVLKKQ